MISTQVLVPFADACAKPPCGLFVAALAALATFSKTGLDADARADGNFHTEVGPAALDLLGRGPGENTGPVTRMVF